MKKESRRSFVRKTAAITSGVLATNVTFQSFANVNENKKLKLAVVGCGGRGSGAVVQALNADDNVDLDIIKLLEACLLAHNLNIKSPWEKIKPIYPTSPIEKIQ